MRKKGIRPASILIAIVIFLACLAVLTYYFLFTTKGSSFIVSQAIDSYVASKDVDIARISGDLSSALVIHDIEWTDLAGLPPGTFLTVQRLEIRALSFGLGGFNVKVDNGRLKFPGSNPILFYGNYTSSSLDLNTYCQQLYVREFLVV